MIIVQIVAGLGNQLFQYAHGRALSIKLNKKLKFDLSFYKNKDHFRLYKLDKFNTHIQIATKEEVEKLKRKIRQPDIVRRVYRKFGCSPFINDQYHFDNERIDAFSLKALKSYSSVYISGYFANQKYFIEIADIIKEEFTLKNLFNKENRKCLALIESSNSVALHVRRGDYIGIDYFAKIPMEYYYNAIEFIEYKYPNSTYFVFSDDLDWVKNNLKTNVNLKFIDINNAATDYMELVLMSRCKHQIIANSTFSWWGAWLNDNVNKIVIAPKIWSNNYAAQKKYENGSLIPDTWLKI